MKEIMKRIGKPDTRSILAIIATTALMGLVTILHFHPVPKENVPLLNTILPMIVSSVVVLCFNFYFGAAKKEEPKKQNNETAH